MISGYYCMMICVKLTNMPATLSRPQAPHCDICSYEQLPPLTRAAVFHQHHSARQYRVLQRVEFETENKLYLCSSCNETHPARVDYGLNICLSDSQLHSFHTPELRKVLRRSASKNLKGYAFLRCPINYGPYFSNSDELFVLFL